MNFTTYCIPVAMVLFGAALFQLDNNQSDALIAGVGILLAIIMLFRAFTTVRPATSRIRGRLK